MSGTNGDPNINRTPIIHVPHTTSNNTTLNDAIVSPPSLLTQNKVVSNEGLVNLVAGKNPIPSHYKFYPRQAFSVDVSKYNDFWENYCQLAFNPHLNNNICIGEILDPENVPFVSEIKIEYRSNECPEDHDVKSNHQFTMALINLHQEIITKNIKLDYDEQS